MSPKHEPSVRTSSSVQLKTEYLLPYRVLTHGVKLGKR